jgi:hypothetical protein
VSHRISTSRPATGDLITATPGAANLCAEPGRAVALSVLGRDVTDVSLSATFH